MKRVLLPIAAILLILAAVILVRALTVTSMQVAAPAAPPLRIDRGAALARFTRAIQFRTVSHEGHSPTTEHEAFVAWIAQAYPRVHASMPREVVNGHSLLYTWRGSDAAVAPILVMGHYDVVPVEPGTESKWQQPPFSGALSGGYVWGRGTLDDKITVISLLEAAESLLAEGFRPRRTIYFAFGHDEEIGGLQGAAHTARLLASRGIRLDAVIDEGGVIMLGSLGMKQPLALVGIAEKGIASVELVASGRGGHSSMPPPRTEVGVIAEAVDRVQKDPFDANIRGATAEMFRWMAPEMPLAKRAVMANLWLFAPLMKMQARSSNSLNALLRTTTAPTIIEGGVKDNVIPSKARAVINFRILPGDTPDGVVEHVRHAIANDRVQIRLRFPQNPSPVSDSRSRQFRELQRTVAQVFPGSVVVPYLVVGATDSRHFGALTANTFRFVPVRIEEQDLERLHGTNERVAVESYFGAIRFYRTLLVNAAR